MTPGERIKARRKELNISALELAERIGKNKATLYRYERGDIENIPTSMMYRIAEILHTTPGYLMGIDSESEHIKNMDMVYPKIYANEQNPQYIKIPVLGKVAAGVPINAVQEICGYEEIPFEWTHSGEIFALKIKGDSMEPKFSENDIVICRQQPDVESGEIAIVLIDGEDAVCKKVLKYPTGLRLISNNPKYLPMQFTNEEIETLPVKILGKVIELRAKF